MLPNYMPRTPPFKHQLEALQTGWQRRGFAYFLEMGLGKTRIAIDNFCLLHRANLVDGLLVITNKSVYTNWTRTDEENPGELQEWLWDGIRETALSYTWRSGKSQKELEAQRVLLSTNTPGVRILAVNVEALSTVPAAYELCRAFLKAHKSMIVVDESTLMQDPRSTRTRRLLELRRLAPYRRILTGSPTKGLPTDLYAQFEFLGEGLLGHRSFYTFRSAYCKMQDIIVNGRTIKKITGTQNLEHLARALEPHSFRRKKEDCLDLPQKIYERREVELTKEQEKIYKDIKENALAEIRDAQQSGIVSAQIVVTQLLRLHQVLCGNVKTDDGRTLSIPNNRLSALEDLLVETDEQAIIWCTYRADVSAVTRMLKAKYGEDSVAEWYGDVPQALREAGEADFQAGRKRFMVATQQAGARGRTWTAATLVVYYSNNHDLELRQQSEDRAHRIGQTRAVTYVDLVCPRTLDERILIALRRKQSVVQTILNDGPKDWI